MKILVTGGAGFIGSHLVTYLLENFPEVEVKVIDNLITGYAPNLDAVRENPRFTFIENSILDRNVMEPLVAWCDHLYHLAAPVGVKLVMERPVHTVLENIRGIDLVLELVNTYKKRVLIASTSEIYGRSLDFLDPTGKGRLKEDDYRVEGATQNHRWAYATTKAMDEFLGFAYHKEYGTEVVITRFFNVVGPNQLADFGMVIPNFIQKALKGEALQVHGEGEQTRSFMHVKDAIRAITQLMFSGKGVGEAFNIGNPEEVTIKELAERIRLHTGSKSEITYIPYNQAFGKGFEDMGRRIADISKLQNALNFELEYNLDGIIQDILLSKKIVK